VVPFAPKLLDPQAGYTICSLDGGGVRGIAALTVLRYLEDYACGIPARLLFDLQFGTSIGGIVALGSAAHSPAYSTREMVAQFPLRLLEIFPGNPMTELWLKKWLKEKWNQARTFLWATKYDSPGPVLQKLLTTARKLRDYNPSARSFVGAMAVTDNTHEPVAFTNL
jgi:patatin-like phospholipase/acyl hydrolase